MTDVTKLDTGFAGSVVSQAEHDEVLRELVHMRGQRDAATRDANEAVAQLCSERTERAAAIARAERAERIAVTYFDLAVDAIARLLGVCTVPSEDHADIEAMRARVKP